MNKFMTTKDDRAVEKMEAILGNKKTEKPIIIKDMVNIFLLGKYPDEAGRDTAGGWRTDCISGIR